MAQAPDVSVVVPTRNRLNLLKRTLAGVLAQRDVLVEVLVVDEASEDETWNYLSAIADSRVRPFRHPTAQGVAATRNTGLANATAAWVAFVDDDDLWAPTKLTRQLLALQHTPGARWSCTGAAVVDEQLVVHRLHAPPDPDRFLEELLNHNCIPGGGSGVLASTGLVRSVGCFDTAFSNLADWDLWIRLALAAPMAVVADPMVASVIHGEAASHDVKGSVEELKRLRSKYQEECRSRGVAMGGWVTGRYQAESYLRGGRRFSAALVELKHATRHGRARSLPWILLATASPASLRRRDRKSVKRIADPALATADAWLEAFRVPVDPSINDLLGHTRGLGSRRRLSQVTTWARAVGQR